MDDVANFQIDGFALFIADILRPQTIDLAGSSPAGYSSQFLSSESARMRPSRSPVVMIAWRLAVFSSIIQAFPSLM